MEPGTAIAIAAAAILLSRPRVEKSAPKTSKDLVRLLEPIEDAGMLPGFRAFAQAVARRESSFNNRAKNTSATEARAAARAYDRAIERGYFRGNTNPRARWVFGSGGWFGFLPATGLAQGGTDGPFRLGSPDLVFDARSSVAMAAEYAAAIIRNYLDGVPRQHRTWLAVRRGWASPSLAADWQEKNERSRAVRQRFELDLMRCCGLRPADLPLATLGTYRGIGGVIRVLGSDDGPSA